MLFSLLLLLANGLAGQLPPPTQLTPGPVATKEPMPVLLTDPTASTPDPSAIIDYEKKFSCFDDTPLYAILKPTYDQLVQSLSLGNISSELASMILSTAYRATYFRKTPITYIRIEKLVPNMYGILNYQLVYYLFREDDFMSPCFRVTPAECSYTGQDFDVYKYLCNKERLMAAMFKRGVIRASTNTGVSAIDYLSNITNCIKTSITKYSLSLDCSLRNLVFNRDALLAELQLQQDLLIAQNYKVTFDTATMVFKYEAPINVV